SVTRTVTRNLLTEEASREPSCEPSRGDLRTGQVDREAAAAVGALRFRHVAAGLVDAYVQVLQIGKIGREQSLDDGCGHRCDRAQSGQHAAQEQDADV